MAEFIGRKAVLDKAGTAVAGVTSTGVTVNGSAVDITTNDDSGWRTLLSDAGVKSVDFAISGISNDLDFIKALISGTDMQDTYTLTFPPEADDNTVTGATITGTFNLVSVSMTGANAEGTTFEATLQSSGAITFTDGASA